MGVLPTCRNTRQRFDACMRNCDATFWISSQSTLPARNAAHLMPAHNEQAVLAPVQHDASFHRRNEYDRPLEVVQVQRRDRPDPTVEEVDKRAVEVAHDERARVGRGGREIRRGEIGRRRGGELES